VIALRSFRLEKPELIAEKILNSEVTILNEIKFDTLKKQYDENS
jgi:hypothetical protein